MKRGISSPSQGHFGNSTKGVFAKTTSNSLPLWHFPHPDPLSRATPPGLCPVFVVVSSPLWGSVQLAIPSRRQGIGFPIVSVTVSGFQHKSKSLKTHLRTVVRSLDQVGNPMPIGLPTPLTQCTTRFPTVVDNPNGIGFLTPSTLPSTIGFPTSNWCGCSSTHVQYRRRAMVAQVW